MRKRLVFVLILTFAVVAGIAAGYISLIVSADSRSTPFVFGIHTNAYVANTIGDPYQPDNVQKAIDLAKQLGVTHLRINLEATGNPTVFPTNDDLIDRVVTADLLPVLIIESPFPIDQFFGQETYDTGFKLGVLIASRYKGKVTYFQLANEISGMTIKPNHPGTKINDYDTHKIAVLEQWLKGLADGIKKGNPKAKRIISSNWIATAIIDHFIAQKVPFEIIGWNWFSDMGDDPTYKILDDGTILDIPGHFDKTGKKFWFVELNHASGSATNQELAQAQYLQTFWDNIKKSPNVHGIFGYTLADFAPYQPENNRYWGFVTLEPAKIPGRFTLGPTKPIFETYQKIIQSVSQTR